MANTSIGWLDWVVLRAAQRRWTRIARKTRSVNIEHLRRLRGLGRPTRTQIDDFLMTADEELTLATGSAEKLRRQKAADWAWRPSLWRERQAEPGVAGAENGTPLGHGLNLFHDCPVSEVTVRQVTNSNEADLAPFGLAMDVLEFKGSFLSIAIGVPDEGVKGLSKSHIVQIDCNFELERKLEVFARLNVQYGPNSEQVVLEFDHDRGDGRVEFDLAYSNINEKRVQKVWVDLIFENPQMNCITMRDLTISRRTRAAL
jgi:hypothetical protein